MFGGEVQFHCGYLDMSFIIRKLFNRHLIFIITLVFIFITYLYLTEQQQNMYIYDIKNTIRCMHSIYQ